MGQGFPWAPKPGSAQSEEALDRSEEAPGRPGIQLQQRNVPPQEASGDVGIGLGRRGIQSEGQGLAAVRGLDDIECSVKKCKFAPLSGH